MEIIAFLELEAVAAHPAAGLPFGTLKRVELARALAGQPKLLLVDEPAGGLNHEEVGALGAILRSIRDRRGVTVLLVEHHMSLVMQVSDRVVVLDFGRKIAEGRARRGAARPRSDPRLPRERELIRARDPRGRGPRRAVRQAPRSSTGSRFAVEAGGITTILGANGAGKTTTLRAVCAMVKTSGEVRFDGQRIDGKTTEDIVRLGIAHTPEGRGTFVDLTVEENLRLGAYARRDRAGLARGLREGVPSTSRCSRSAGASRRARCRGGEQQMLAVARALMSGPRLLLLDEPSLGLAPLIVREIFRIVRTINQRGGRQRPARGAERRPRARPGRPRVPARDRPRGDVGPAPTSSRRTTPSAARISGTEERAMDIFVQQVVSGLATGGIYASLALALVMIYQATDVVNFAQGEMAMFSTYLAWSMLQAGLPYWVAFFAHARHRLRRAASSSSAW